MTEPVSLGDWQPDRNLAMELVRATEAAAMRATPWIGRGDKNAADGAAVDAMRRFLSTVNMKGTVVIGEGEKDDAPWLYNGEVVGNGEGAECDVAVDPIDGTRLTAEGRPGALSVIAVADRGSMYDPSAVFYMDKLVCGPGASAWSTSTVRSARTSARWLVQRRSTFLTFASRCWIVPATSSSSPTSARPVPALVS